MAIVIEEEADTMADTDPSVTTLTVDAGEILIACIGIHQGTVNDVTWNSNSMTQGVAAATAFNERAEIWYDLSPDTGNNTLTFDGTSGGGRFLCGLVLSGVKTTGQPDQSGTNTGSDASIESASVTPSSDGSLIIDSVYSEATLNSAGADQTIQANQQGDSYENGGASTFLQPTAAAKAFDWTLSSGQRWASAILTLEPAAAATGIASMRQLVGHGQGIRG